MTALLVGLSMAIGASAADVYDFTYNNLQFVITGSTTHPVAQKQANELGLYDMSGNVAEWCSDWYDANYYSVSPSVNPTGPESGYQRVSRGGGYDNATLYIRVAFRNNPTPGNVRNYQGLRLAQ